jgi:hypothetical protein
MALTKEKKKRFLKMIAKKAGKKGEGVEGKEEKGEKEEAGEGCGAIKGYQSLKNK